MTQRAQEMLELAKDAAESIVSMARERDSTCELKHDENEVLKEAIETILDALRLAAQADAPGGLDAATVEACAKVAEDPRFSNITKVSTTKGPEWTEETGNAQLMNSHARFIAAAIRVLAPGKNHLWRHKKRGTVYEVLGDARVQTEKPLADMDTVRVYRDVKSGSLSVRPPAEFEDGRFEAMD